MTQKILTWSFYILFFFTPLFFTPFNSELFEFNKMWLVYFLATIIVGTWLIKCINHQSLILNRTPLDIPIFLFLLSQILSTITSTDIHTSLWGYYSRANGGLVSTISYILLYYALVSNFDWAQAQKFLKAALWGGLAVALYAIPEHFGLSPSCVILQHTFTADCWVQDVQSRVFATLGQPNWLAAYMEMLIFPAIYFALTSKTRNQTILYSIISILYYLAFTFTYSRGAMLGFVAGIVIFIVLHFGRTTFFERAKRVEKLLYPKLLLIIIGILIAINLFFGSALTGDFKLLQSSSLNARPTINSVGTQLENGGTESGAIRLIVWRGAIDIFKHYPIFGSGVETFAYAYYNFRPVEHNLVSEWDFLYNKAHNEYLNYLATTGLVGFISYIVLILAFIVWSLQRIFNLISNFKFQISNSQQLLVTSILASYVAYLIQNFFGFSVVIVALFFFLFPGFAFLAADDLKTWKLSKNNLLYQLIQATILRKRGFQLLTIWVVVVITGLILFILCQYWIADKFYKDGQDFADTGSPGKAYATLFDAVSLNPNEPLYKAELGNAAAESAVSLESEDATSAGILKKQAVDQTQKALNISPTNTSVWRTAIRTYFDLSLIDQSFEQKTLDTFDSTIKLAPTDPKLHYNKALVLESMNRTDEEIQSLKEAVKLKSNYLEAISKLGDLYLEKKQYDLAKQQYEAVLKLVPNDTGTLDKLQQIATQSAKTK